jgi:hypothetical protein
VTGAQLQLPPVVTVKLPLSPFELTSRSLELREKLQGVGAPCCMMEMV